MQKNQLSLKEDISELFHISIKDKVREFLDTLDGIEVRHFNDLFLEIYEKGCRSKCVEQKQNIKEIF